jgi:hypothetical protein
VRDALSTSVEAWLGRRQVGRLSIVIARRRITPTPSLKHAAEGSGGGDDGGYRGQDRRNVITVHIPHSQHTFKLGCITREVVCINSATVTRMEQPGN